MPATPIARCAGKAASTPSGPREPVTPLPKPKKPWANTAPQTTELAQARSAAATLIARLDAVDEVSGVELPALAAYNEAVASAHQSPDGDTELAAHLESALVAVTDAPTRCVPKPATL